MAASTGRKFSFLLTNFCNILTNRASRFQKSRLAFLHCSSYLSDPVQEINMPSLSPTMEEGKIVKWLKKEGDIISPGDVLCDIETDKAIVSMEVEEDGILAKILVPENSERIKIGTLIALVVSQDEDWRNVKVPAGVRTSGSDSSSSSLSSSSSSSDSNAEDGDQDVAITGPSATTVKMPSLSPTMTTGTIVKWLKKEGETIAPGDALCDIQTDKAVMTLEAEEEGILAKIIAPDDSKDINVGSVIAVIVPEGEDYKTVTVTLNPPKKKSQPQSKSVSIGTAETAEVRGKTFGPAVKALLSVYQLEPGLIKPTGKNNRLLKEDILQYISDNKLEKKPPKFEAGPSKSGPAKSISKPESVHSKKFKDSAAGVSKYNDFEITNIRRTIAKRLVQSKQDIPHFYSVAKVNVDKLVKARQAFFTEGIKVSLNDFITKGVALSLQMYPKANALYINNEIQLAKNVDVCVAVATDNGLYTPIVKTANEKSVMKISQEIKELAAKAKSGKLKPEEYQGGTFTISNLGMFGITQFKAIINPPQCGILAVGTTTEILNADFMINKQMILSLSSDRRVLQEHEAAEFMNILKYILENPDLIIMDANHYLDVRL